MTMFTSILLSQSLLLMVWLIRAFLIVLLWYSNGTHLVCPTTNSNMTCLKIWNGSIRRTPSVMHSIRRRRADIRMDNMFRKDDSYWGSRSTARACSRTPRNPNLVGNIHTLFQRQCMSAAALRSRAGENNQRNCA